MYYCLDKRYGIRSWSRRTCCLLDKDKGRIIDLPSADFNTLVMLDGKTGSTSFSDKQLEVIDKYCDDGILIRSESPLEPDDGWLRIFKNQCMPSLYWSITGKCNYNCRHCFLSAPEALFGECTTDEALNLIDQIAECGIPVVTISGGEPLVRDDLWTIIDALRNKSIIIDQIYTNGELVNEALLDQFEVRHMKPMFCFSFDGLDWHDWLRGHKGAEKAVLRAMQLCHKHGFRFSAEMCIHRGNAGDLRRNINFLAEIGASGVKLGCIETTDLWRSHAEGNELNSKEFYPYVLDYIPYYYMDHVKIRVELCPFITLYPEDRNNPYTFMEMKHDPDADPAKTVLCGSARNSCYVSPDLRVMPCMPMASVPYREVFPSLREVSLKECLQKGLYLETVKGTISDLMERNEKCSSCKDRIVCGGGCRAKALLGADQKFWGCDYDACFIMENGLNRQMAACADKAIAEYRNGKT